MSTPSTGASTSGDGLEGLPSDIQAQIRAYVDAELAKVKAQYEPAPPKELTPAEKYSAAVAAARAAENGDKAVVSGSGRTHDAVFTALDILGAAVFPADTPASTPDTPPSANDVTPPPTVGA